MPKDTKQQPSSYPSLDAIRSAINQISEELSILKDKAIRDKDYEKVASIRYEIEMLEKGKSIILGRYNLLKS